MNTEATATTTMNTQDQSLADFAYERLSPSQLQRLSRCEPGKSAPLDLLALDEPRVVRGGGGRTAIGDLVVARYREECAAAEARVFRSAGPGHRVRADGVSLRRMSAPKVREISRGAWWTSKPHWVAHDPDGQPIRTGGAVPSETYVCGATLDRAIADLKRHEEARAK